MHLCPFCNRRTINLLDDDDDDDDDDGTDAKQETDRSGTEAVANSHIERLTLHDKGDGTDGKSWRHVQHVVFAVERRRLLDNRTHTRRH